VRGMEIGIFTYGEGTSRFAEINVSTAGALRTAVDMQIGGYVAGRGQ